MMKRILVAVDDSSPAMAAARLAVDLAHEMGAALHVVTVGASGQDGAAALRHVAGMAAAAGVVSESTTTDGGHAFEVILDEAQRWGADLIVMGRSDKRRRGLPYVGSQTEHLLEFTPIPVLVVPGNDAAASTGRPRS